MLLSWNLNHRDQHYIARRQRQIFIRDRDEIVGLLKGISNVAEKLRVSINKGKGYRTLANINEHGGQEVPHLHFHIFGGEKVGKMVEWVLKLREII